ncbi:hypothetical protein [Prochlorococcus sp. MIT 1223]|uniref:hypothetical protein n=1 Tax=Prochlorococcus sp. MIT 1223 TaxID=3096217 RepID=UPI002A7641FF|nr:hypothetical protein [Prochlorococcus sp. MIT 1223]
MRLFLSTCLTLILITLPVSIKAQEIDLSINQIEEIEVSNEITTNRDIAFSQEEESTSSMSPQEIDDLFGPEPYLGPTSWLGSKEGRSK